MPFSVLKYDTQHCILLGEKVLFTAGVHTCYSRKHNLPKSMLTPLRETHGEYLICTSVCYLVQTKDTATLHI